MLKLFWNWLSISSADPGKVALTLKAGIPTILALSALAGLHLDGGLLGDSAQALASTLVSIFSLVSGLVTLYGLARKIFLTIKA